MCEFFSGWITRGHRVKAQLGVDSHTDLQDLFPELKKLDNLERMECAKFEFTPPNEWDGKGFDGWQYKTDQDVVPKWYDPDTGRESVISYLKTLPCIESGQELPLLATPVLFCAGKIGRMVGAAYIGILSRGGTLNDMRGGTLNAMRGGTLNAMRGGTLNAMWGGTLNAMWGGTLNAMCGGTLNAMCGGTLNDMRGGTLNDMCGGTLKNDYRPKAGKP